MASHSPAGAVLGDFTLDPRTLARSAVNGIRAAFGIGGVVALILGIVLLVSPAKTLGIVAVILGIYFLVAGVIRLALRIFSNGINGGLRTLNILFGILLVIAGIIALKNVAATTAALLILVVAVIGVGWIIEGVLTVVESRGAPSPAWAIAYGIISILAGLIVLVVPGWSALWLILMTGIVLIVLGLVGIVRAFTFGREVLKATA